MNNSKGTASCRGLARIRVNFGKCVECRRARCSQGSRCSHLVGVERERPALSCQVQTANQKLPSRRPLTVLVHIKDEWSESYSVMVWLFVTPWTVYSLWNSPGQNTGVGSLSLLQEIFPTQGSNPGLPRCRWMLYQLSHKGSPGMLEWVAYPFSRRTSQPGNRTRVSCIAGGYFTNWAIREAFKDERDHFFQSLKMRDQDWKKWNIFKSGCYRYQNNEASPPIVLGGYCDQQRKVCFHSCLIWH